MRQLTQAIHRLIVVYFTSDFDNRRARLWMIKLTDCTLQRWSDDGKTCICSSGCDFRCIHCQAYFATYCDIWIGSSRAINCTSKLRYVQQTSFSEKQVHCDDQILPFELKELTQTRQFKHTVTLKSLRTLKTLCDLRLRNAARVEIEASLGSS